MEKLCKLESAVNNYVAATSRFHNFLGFLSQLSGRTASLAGVQPAPLHIPIAA